VTGPALVEHTLVPWLERCELTPASTTLSAADSNLSYAFEELVRAEQQFDDAVHDYCLAYIACTPLGRKNRREYFRDMSKSAACVPVLPNNFFNSCSLYSASHGTLRHPARTGTRCRGPIW
jgi:hypothetical protein